MSNEHPLNTEKERKETWLKNLADFIVIANGKTWAADGAEVDPQRPGYKELQWPYPSIMRKNVEKMTEEELEAYEAYKGWEDWMLRDSYTGYFRAPGMTTVYYKGQPVWTMQYGGHGQTEGYEDRVRQTYKFLKAALKQVTPEMPFRGPKEYVEDNKRYEFTLLEGDITDCLWREKITEDNQLTFTQTGIAGIVIHRDGNKQPQLPWNI